MRLFRINRLDKNYCQHSDSRRVIRIHVMALDLAYPLLEGSEALLSRFGNRHRLFSVVKERAIPQRGCERGQRHHSLASGTIDTTAGFRSGRTQDTGAGDKAARERSRARDTTFKPKAFATFGKLPMKKKGGPQASPRFRSY